MRARSQIHQVGRQAGVSAMTVSRVFSGNGSVAPATRERVLRAADSLGWRPNILLRSLRGKRTASVGFIWSFWDPVTSDGEIGSNLMERLQGRGYATYQTQYRADDVCLIQALEDFVKRRVDAVVIGAEPCYLRAPVLQRWLAGVPAVVAVTPHMLRSFPGDQVVHDRNSGIAEAVAYLAATGRRHPVMATWLPEESNRLKFRHFAACCRRHGIAHDGLHLPLLPSGGREKAPGYRRTFAEALRDGRKMDAIFVFNDLAAMCALRELQLAGRRVPDDVAVIGFGNNEACGVCNPPLASGDRRHEEVVECAERLLFERLAAPGLPPRRERVRMRFVWRESAGPRISEGVQLEGLHADGVSQQGSQ